jgi:hypothetical protein
MDRGHLIEIGAKALHDHARATYARAATPPWCEASDRCKTALRADVEAMLAAWAAHGLAVEMMAVELAAIKAQIAAGEPFDSDEIQAMGANLGR